MDLNATILCEFFIFWLFYKVVQKHVWPSFRAILNEREFKIAAGLESAAKGHRILQEAHTEAAGIVKDALKKAEEIIIHAEQQAAERKDELHYELELMRNSSKKQAEEEYNNLQSKFYLEAKTHYLEIASKLYHIVISDPSTKKSVDDAILQRALIQLESP